MHAAADDGPLPDEQPAAALWWRLSRHLSPAAVAASGSSVSETLRPEWTASLADILGTNLADRITADPGWPGLVAAVTHGTTAGWDAVALIDAAHDMIQGGQDDTAGTAQLRPSELTKALTWRVSMLTDPDPVGAVATRSTTSAPVDPDTDADAAPSLDDDWLASLAEPDPEADDRYAPPPEDLAEPPEDLHASRPAPHTDGVRWVADAGEDDTSRGSLYEYPSSAEIPRERVVALNQAAGDFYAAAYPTGWAAGYVADRLGHDLANARADDTSDRVTLEDFHLGYAPDGWTSLVDHLRSTAAATDSELVAAGLAKYASTGRLLDRFRDRLVFPVTAIGPDGGPEIHGFITRRNPRHDPPPGQEADPRHGPKYLNTPETDLFRKGNELFGYAETQTLLAGGATPVDVEGPMDALAVTLAGGGRYVGLAPMGTALTDTQADQLLAHPAPAGSTSARGASNGQKQGVIVATDNDRAGIEAAHRAYWQLVQRGDSPRRLSITGGKDPAEMLHDHGPKALREALDASPSLAGALVTAVVDGYAHRFDTVEGRVDAQRRACEIIAALPPEQWAPHTTRVMASTNGHIDTLLETMLDAHDEWLSNPADYATRHSARKLPEAITPPPTARWAQLAESINPRLTWDPSWPALARAINRAAVAGVDVNTELPALAARRPLPSDHPARSLEYRLLDAHPDALDPAHAKPTLGQVRAAESKAAARLAADEPTPTASAPPRRPETPTDPLPTVTPSPATPGRDREPTTPRR